ncbi:MAG: 50S ribosome-binding GTPase [Candidatus Micrarchaeota archaeon]|nr:50S ribosome-binding GTPase [Candidatus Micrarchaeota archaeon]
MGVEDKIKTIEDEMARTQYHKGTEHHFGKLRAKLAHLKKMVGQHRKGGARFSVRKSGDATVILIGDTSAGKSSIFNRLTRANSKVGDHPFTTQKILPGIMNYGGAQIQILDTPALELGEAEILSFASIADLVVIVCDYSKKSLERIMKGLEKAKVKGELLVVINKCDVEWGGGFCVSAISGEGIDGLREEIYRRLRLVRVYMKPRGGEADGDRPLVVKEGSFVRDVCEKLRLKGDMEYALVWGNSAKFPGQKVGEEHVLKDGDVLTIVMG